MITGFGFTQGEASMTFTDASYQDGIPEDLIQIGAMMALEDWMQFGPNGRGYDHVAVACQEPAITQRS